MWNKKEMSQLDATLTRVPLTLTFDSQNKLYLGNGRPDCHGTRGRESIGCPDVNTKEMSQQDAEGQIVSREWEAMLWNKRDGSQ